MRFITLSLLIVSFITQSIAQTPCFSCANAPEGTIFCDDFESGEPLNNRYFEYGDNGGNFVPLDNVGRDGSIGMRVHWMPGQVNAGGFKKSIGKTPGAYIGKHAASPDSMYDEIYWRIDIRTQKGWQGGGADKLSRAMTLVNNNWAQGMIAHIWSSGPNNEYLGMDPASGISSSGKLLSRKYNDFEKLRWLGFKLGKIDLFSTSNSGKWYCVVAHVKLNTPGKQDGIFEFWINDSLQAGSYDLNWHGDWNKDPEHFKINAIFIENYWNKGAVMEQERYLDNFVISTKAIPCSCTKTTTTTPAPTLIKAEIYPNPNQGNVIVKVDRSIAINGYFIRLYDSQATLVLETKKIKNIFYTMDINNNIPGIYYYQLITDDKIVKTGSFQIIQ